MALEPAKDAADYENALHDVHRRVCKAHQTLIERGDLPLWTVYGPGTTDQTGLYVSRLFSIADGMSRPSNVLLRANTLDEIRALLPPGLVRMPRQPEDDRNIIEVWF